jgi:hypothetical protein
MRLVKPLTAVAMLLVPMTSQVSAQDFARPTLMAEQCQPLSSANYELCCIALNRDQLLPADQAGQCPPLTDTFVQRVMEEARARQEAARPAPRVDDTPTGSIRRGNPNRNVNAGRGDGGEDADGNPIDGGEGADADADPGKSGDHNAAGEAGPGAGKGGGMGAGGGRGGK